MAAETPAPAASARPAAPRADAELAAYSLDVEAVAAALDTDAGRGLTAEQAVERLARDGRNELARGESTPAWRMLLAQFNDFMIWVLLGAAVLAAIEGQVLEAVAIGAILALNAVLGFVQEYRAEQAMEALRELSAPTASVIRDGAEREVPAAELVAGDLVVLEAGDRIPADGRLVEASALSVDEASLTGESHAVRKTTAPVADSADHTALGDRTSMVFAGTAVAAGHGHALITATGPRSEVGHIAELLEGADEGRTPLQDELHRVGRRIASAIMVIAVIVFASEAVRAYLALGLPLDQAIADPAFQQTLTQALLVAVALAVAAIPEGLPAIVTLALSLAVKTMAARNAIVRRLHSVETLGSTTFIASDKTGTLTRNEMAVRRLVVGFDGAAVTPDGALVPDDATPDRDDLERLLRIAACANDARFDDTGALLGDPTETALLAAADALSDDRIRPARIAEAPFDSERKRMTTVHRIDGRTLAYTKGATDVVLALCERVLVRGEELPLDGDARDRLVAVNESLAGSGFRTLALAERAVPADADLDHPGALETGLLFVGIAAMIDPPRAEVPAAIATAHRAGIRVAMVTGDHALTATAIARDIGLIDPDADASGLVITGPQIEAMTDDELAAVAPDTRVFARVDPAHKLRIVEALVARGETVAMTGDGVNDAPALKRADIGVAMGLVGTDVAREAADMVLADDDFATIVAAVAEGRRVFADLRKAIDYLLSGNVAEVLTIFIISFFTAQPALLPLQLLWNNLVTDGPPALALAIDPPEPGLMDRPPRARSEGMLAPHVQGRILWQGLVLTCGALAAFVWGAQRAADPALAQTMVFTTIVLAELFHSLNSRCSDGPILRRCALANRWLVLAIVVSIGTQLVILYVPFLANIFGTVPLGWGDWGAVAVCALVPVFVIDAIKTWLVRRARRA